MNFISNIRLYEKYPMLYDIEKYKHYNGIIFVDDSPVNINLYAPSFPALNNTKISLFEGYLPYNVKVDFSKYNNFYEFVEDLPNQIKLSKSVSSQPVNQKIKSYENCFKQIEEVLKQLNSLIENESNDESVSEYTTSIKTVDGQIHITFNNFYGYETHFLLISINNENQIYVKDSSLPVDNQFFNGTNTSLRNLLTTFTSTLKQLDDFYSELNTIDTLCFVVDPPELNTKLNSRTIKFNDRVYLKIIIDPFNSTSVTLKIIGPTNDIEILRQMYNTRMQDWDDNIDVYKNLLKIFDLMYFPMKNTITENNDEENEQYCNICYTYRLNNQLPLVHCDNRRCNLIFHSSCLKKWFSTLKDTKTFLEVTFGSCPFCKEKISTSYIDLYN